MTLDTDSYRVADSFFGRPYIDRDESRDSPVPHRNVHGGFEGTDTRFTFYFPAAEAWGGRMFHPLEGAHAGHEEVFGGFMGEIIGGLSLIVRLGGYMVESNSGHIADDIDPAGGDDPTIYGHRASIESARFSKHIATQVYGRPPHHSYVWGGSGGGRRSPMCLEYGGDVYDGALPFMGGGEIVEWGSTARIRGAQTMSFASMFNVQRLLRGGAIDGVIDAMAPGGSGDPFAGLGTHEREELGNLYRQGFPAGDEPMIASPMGQMWLWTSIADLLQEEHPEYFAAFWNEPGYVGHDQPQYVEPDLIDVTLPVTRVIRGRDLLERPEEYTTPETQAVIKDIVFMSTLTGALDLPVAVEVAGIDGGYRLGAAVEVVSGAAAGRRLYAMYAGGDIFSCDGRDKANIQRFTGVEPGDLVHVSNRAFLAFCYFYRHHAMEDPQFDFLRPGGRYVYPQHPVPLMSPLMGVGYSGKYDGKLLWVHHTHDSSLWPPQGLIYQEAVRKVRGVDGANEQFRLRWTENAEHIGPAFLPGGHGRPVSTWLIDYTPIIEQSLADLAAWVEDGVEPAGTSYEERDNQIILPPDAATRGGIQPVIAVTANGGQRVEVGVGATVTVTVQAEMPPGAGFLTSLEWDLDGSGTFAGKEQLAGTETSLQRSVTCSFDSPGHHFVTARVAGHREGDVASPWRQLLNVASARVVVE